MMRKLLLDTDILSGLMKKNPIIQEKSREYLSEHNIFSFSIITKYEILRGLKSKNALKQIDNFLALCNMCMVFPIDDKIIIKASDIYANLRKKGQTIGDADILIGATAIVNNYGVVTNNHNHFNRIEGLHIDKWLL